MQEGNIQFIANFPAWKCIKKFRTTIQTDPRTLAEFLGSYTISLDAKFESYLHKFLDMAEFDTRLKKSPGKGAPLPVLMQFLHDKEMNDITQKAVRNIDPVIRENYVKVLQAYAARKVLREKGLFAEHAQVEIPGLKRLLKKKA